MTDCLTIENTQSEYCNENDNSNDKRVIEKEK